MGIPAIRIAFLVIKGINKIRIYLKSGRGVIGKFGGVRTIGRLRRNIRRGSRKVRKRRKQ